MRIFLCIDDTDNMDSKGTGEIAYEIANLIESIGWGNCHYITRHQLLVHPDVPYTSHNSSMCFTADIKEGFLDSVIDAAMNYLESNSAEGSDPGLCVFVPERFSLHDHQAIIDFGLKAKRQVMTKNDAYELAKDLSLHLSEHGGTGQGIIGALAGVGLRLTGNDGRLKGKIRINPEKQFASVKEILDNTPFEAVRTQAGLILAESENVTSTDKLKGVLLNHRPVLLVESQMVDGERKWLPCSGNTLKQY